MSGPDRVDPFVRLAPRPVARRALVAAALALPGAARANAPVPQGAPQRVNLMFCGDSLAQGLFLTLNPILRRRDGMRVTNGTQHATGITRGDEHDWPTVTRDLVARHRPDLVIVWIGANDFRPLVLREQRSRLTFGTDAFAEHYARRVKEMATAVADGGGRAVWLGLPNMRDAQFAGAVRTLNELQAAGAEQGGALFVPTWDATSDAQGRYTAVMEGQRGPRGFRAEDGVHFTDFGYRRIAAIAFDRAAESFPEVAGGLAGAGEA
jgi:hypothetical protein